MLDFAWSELLVVIVVAVLVIGPKDIPKMMQGLGRIMRRIHYMKFALSQQFEDLMKETELEQLRAEAQKAAGDLPADLADTDEAAFDDMEAAEIAASVEKEEQDDKTDDISSPDTTRH